MGTRRAILRFVILVLIGIGGPGCGSPEGAGSIDMGKAKAIAAERGIPEAKAVPAVSSKAAKSRAAPRPTEALPKGGR